MAFKRHSSRKPSQKYHVYYPQLDQKSQDRIQPVDQRRINLDSFYISGFIHQEQNQLLTSKISRGSLGKDSNITSKRKEAQRTKLGQNDLALMMKTSPYLHKKSLVDRKQGRPKVRSRHIEQYFVTVRNEMEASITIQLFWRRILAVRRFHYLTERKQAATTIQATFRGYLTRLRVEDYLKKMDYFVRLTQARLRRRLVTKRWTIYLDIMQKSAVFIQRNIRKYLAKCLVQKYLVHNAAMRIQMSYRTALLRRKLSNRRRCNSAVTIQRVARRIQASRQVNIFRKEVNEASQNIQRCWRGYMARKMRSKVLLLRCFTKFRNRIKVLDSKIDYFETQLEKFLMKAHTGKIQSDYDESLQNCNRMKAQLESCERDIEELEQSRSFVNPYEVEIGLDAEIEQRLIQERQLKTTLQLDMLFNVKRKLFANRRELDCINQKKKIFEDRINELRDERDSLRERLCDYERQESRRHAYLNYRKAIADEKRKWKIVPRTSSGKPRKKCNHPTPIIGSYSGSEHDDVRIDILTTSHTKMIELIEQNLFYAQMECCKAMLDPIHKFQNYN